MASLISIAGICTSVGGSLSTTMLHCRSSSDEGLDVCAPPSPSPSAADTLSGEFAPSASNTKTFGADIADRNAYPREKGEGLRRFGTPRVVRTVRLSRTVLIEEERPVLTYRSASRNSAEESWHETVGVRTTNLTMLNEGGNMVRGSVHDSLRRGFASGEELPVVSARGYDNTHMPSASSTSEAIAILKHRQEQGLSIDSYMFVDILKRCSKQKDLIATRQVHDYIYQNGMQKQPQVANTLLSAYVKCESLQDARRVFDGLERNNRNVITWNVMIGGYAKHGCGVEAYQLFVQMNLQGFVADAFTYASILNPSASAGALGWVREVHGHARKGGLESNLRVGNALVHMYANSGSIDEARLVFDRLEERNVVTWTMMIGAYAESGSGMEAYRLFLEMKREGLVADAFTYASILNPSASAGALEWVREVHGHARKGGLESNLRVGNALVHMYAKSGSIGESRLAFDRMEERDVITWNTIIGAYAESGNGMEAYRLFLEMKKNGFIPNAITCLSILKESASAGASGWVNEVHSDARRLGLDSNLSVGNALLQMYAKSGSIDDARLVFHRMGKRDEITWNIMIAGLAEHGCGHEALELFRTMNAGRVKPDATSFVAVLSACSHAGLLEDGRRLFLAMTEDYGIKPSVVHYTCMVDLLGRAGHLEEAKLFIEVMPTEPDAVIWRALLGACRTHGNVELGELAAKEVLKLDPKDASTYVLLSSIYAAVGKWEKVSSVSTMMRERGVRKEPGRSWIEVDNKTHEFVVGDTSHPESKAIYTELNKLTENLKAEGYVPDTQLVLRNIDEEAKELALCSHSEKLAITYGLMRTPHGKPIRVYKNLRVCSDCHTATKLISKLTGREIIARDSNRFHHFKDGVCSCGDYW